MAVPGEPGPPALPLDERLLKLEILRGKSKAVRDFKAITRELAKSATLIEARERLINRFSFSPLQANYVLDVPFWRLTHAGREEFESQIADILRQLDEPPDPVE